MLEFEEPTRADLDALAAPLKAELSRLVKVLAGHAYPGERVTGAMWRDRLDFVARQLPAERRITDWDAWVPLGRITDYIAAANHEIEMIEVGSKLEW